MIRDSCPRQKQQRNFLATLMLSQGVPMILAGDELGRTQQGNNNTYCQDSELSWINWLLGQENQFLLEFTRKLIHFRRRHPAFARRHWFQGRAIHGSGVHDIGWYNPDGGEITEEQWHDGSAKAIGIFLNGEEIIHLDSYGQRVFDDSFLLFFNAQPEPQQFAIPAGLADRHWRLILDTQHTDGFVARGKRYQPSQTLEVTEFSLQVLSCEKCFGGS
jgi:isoamylase